MTDQQHPCPGCRKPMEFRYHQHRRPFDPWPDGAVFVRVFTCQNPKCKSKGMAEERYDKDNNLLLIRPVTVTGGIAY